MRADYKVPEWLEFFCNFSGVLNGIEFFFYPWEKVTLHKGCLWKVLWFGLQEFGEQYFINASSPAVTKNDQGLHIPHGLNPALMASSRELNIRTQFLQL